MTNFERIKEMNLEEMRDFLARVESGDVDFSRTLCDMWCDGQYECGDCIRWWLSLDTKHPQGLDYWTNENT